MSWTVATLDPITLLASLAAIIVIGYLGSRLFETFRITDILLLVGLGVILGPVTGTLEPAMFQALAPVLGTFTLLVILFEGGLGLRFHDLLTGLTRASLLAVLGWSLTVVAVAVVTTLVLGWDPLLGLLLGSILGGSSSIVVIPLVQALSTSDHTRVTLSVESALTDVLCVVGALALLNIITTGVVDAQVALTFVASRFSVAIVAGALVGFLWEYAWRHLERGPYGYMLTLALLLALHVLVELLGGSGPIAVLTFGIMLGNRALLHPDRVDRAWERGGDLRRLQSEVVFFVRTFFFVALGILVDVDAVTDPRFLGVAALLLVALVVARGIAVFLSTRGDPDLSRNHGVLLSMLPRGLAAAVLAVLPAQRGVPGTERFVGYAFAIIILTNVVVTVAIRLLPVSGPFEAPGSEDVLPPPS